MNAEGGRMINFRGGFNAGGLGKTSTFPAVIMKLQTVSMVISQWRFFFRIFKSLLKNMHKHFHVYYYHPDQQSVKPIFHQNVNSHAFGPHVGPPKRWTPNAPRYQHVGIKKN